MSSIGDFERVDLTIHFTGTRDTVEFANWQNRDAQRVMDGFVGSDGTTNITLDNGQRVIINRAQMTFAELKRRST